jgi:hypothetical protein
VKEKEKWRATRVRVRVRVLFDGLHCSAVVCCWVLKRGFLGARDERRVTG